MLYWVKEDNRTEGRNPYSICIARKVLLRYYPGDISGAIRSSQKKSSVRNWWEMSCDSKLSKHCAISLRCACRLCADLDYLSKNTIARKGTGEALQGCYRVTSIRGLYEVRFFSFLTKYGKDLVMGGLERVSRECLLVSDIKLFY